MRSLVTAVALAAALAGCSSGAGSSPTAAPVATPQGPQAGGATTCASAPATSKGAAGSAGTTDLSKKPQIEVPDTPPPCNLVVSDIVEGKGAAAKPGDQLTMKYVGVLYGTGKQFDASWDRGEDFPFTLGAGMVIQGWDQGLVGMKVGGRRQLTIPPDLGYGAQGAGADIPPNAALIFVVDLVKIG